MANDRHRSTLQYPQDNSTTRADHSSPQAIAQVRPMPPTPHKHSRKDSKAPSAQHSKNSTLNHSKALDKWRSRHPNATSETAAALDEGEADHCFSGFSLQGRAFRPTLAFIGGCLCAVAGLALIAAGAAIDANDGTHAYHFLAMWVCGIALTAVSFVVCSVLYCTERFSCFTHFVSNLFI